MRNSKILAKIRAGQPARVAQLGHYLPPFIAYAAHLGYDGIWLDLEHRPMDAREVQALLAFFHLYDIDCLVRPATREKALLYRYFEDGAAGLVVPHVSTPDEARDLVRKVKFPPVGDRGLHGGSLEANYLLDLPTSRDPLVAHALRETFLVVQIETPEAVANMDVIASINGVDGIFIGPADLGIRMPLEPENQRVKYADTLARAAGAAQAHGKFWATMPRNTDDLRQMQELDAKMFVWGTDTVALLDGLRKANGDLDTVLGGN